MEGIQLNDAEARIVLDLLVNLSDLMTLTRDEEALLKKLQQRFDSANL